jgi:spermidine/putrescine transport system ATP-binding protein
VFQDYALFPHMTVEENVGYGLKVRAVRPRDIAARVAQTLALVQLGDLGARYPSQLSGGQRQRVALARAIICQPRLILLDEPLAALDVELRRQMQAFLKSVQREIRTTFLFVTHDQEEAIAMADRICVMNSGRIQQIGTPVDLYYRPRTEFVARFFGDNNLIKGELGEWVESSPNLRVVKTPYGDFRCALDGESGVADLPLGAPAFVMVRPENVSLAPVAATASRLSASLKSVEFAGATSVIVAAVKGPDGQSMDIRVKLQSKPAGMSLRPGQPLDLAWRPEESALVPA